MDLYVNPHYLSNLAHLQARKTPLATFACPDCSYVIETPRPQAGPPWTAGFECPCCEHQFNKTVHRNGVVMLTLPVTKANFLAVH